MLQFLDSADDTIALAISDKITGADLNAIMDRLDEVMAKHDRVHVFVESHGLNGIEIAGLPTHVARATPLFSKLKRFGRVAVVADQLWVRAGTRMESAVLPFISYKTFMPERRDEAFAWVQGLPTK